MELGAADRFKRIAMVAEAFTGSVEPEDLLPTLIAQGLTGMGADGGVLAVIGDGTRLDLVGTVGRAVEGVAALEPLPLERQLPLCHAARSGEAVWIPSRSEGLARFPDMAAHMPHTQAWAAVPLAADGAVFGALGFTFESSREFTADDRTFLAALADLAALTVSRLVSVSGRGSDPSSIDRIGTVGDAFTGALTPAEIVEIIIRQGAVGLGADFAGLATVDRDGRIHLIAAAGHLSEIGERFEGLTIDDDTVLSYAIREIQAVWLPSRAEAARRFPGRSWLVPGREAGLIVPLVANGRSFGALGITFSTPRSFTERDKRFFLALGDLTALALDRALATADSREVSRLEHFIATVSHELRNPVAAIRGAVDLIDPDRSAPPDPDRLRRAHGILDRQVTQLTRLLDDLLDVARADRNGLSFEPVVVDLARVVEAAIEMTRSLIDQSGHRLQVTAGNEPLIVRGDPHRLAQAVANLLRNAAHYTEAGGTIQVVLHRRDDQGVVDVIDDGIGLDPAAIDRLFQPFTRTPEAMGMAPGGMGIGLNLVRRIVEVHGGEVDACSDGPDHGSIFEIRLPLAGGGAPRSGSTIWRW